MPRLPLLFSPAHMPRTPLSSSLLFFRIGSSPSLPVLPPPRRRRRRRFIVFWESRDQPTAPSASPLPPLPPAARNRAGDALIVASVLDSDRTRLTLPSSIRPPPAIPSRSEPLHVSRVSSPSSWTSFPAFSPSASPLPCGGRRPFAATLRCRARAQHPGPSLRPQAQAPQRPRTRMFLAHSLTHGAPPLLVNAGRSPPSASSLTVRPAWRPAWTGREAGSLCRWPGLTPGLGRP